MRKEPLNPPMEPKLLRTSAKTEKHVFYLFEENANELAITILEFIGLALTGSHHLMRQPKAMIFYGASGANGKSALQQVCEGIMPKGSVGHVLQTVFERTIRRRFNW